MSSTLWVGIDPGASGGIAFIPNNGREPWAIKMPETEKDIWDVISSVNAHGDYTKVVAALESVHAMPKQGVTSTFTFGQGFGGLRMALTAAGLRWHLVTPQKWQKVMGCMTRGDKNISKAMAQRLYPKIKVTHAIADALLIAHYCSINLD